MDKAIEVIGLFGSLLLGLFLAARFIGLIKKRFVDAGTRLRWQAEFEQYLTEWPEPLRRILMFIDRLASHRT
ncbi:hypothetical protein [Lysobacter soli]|uniref:hypothetical protein n=1 Tax=Lysobacter soli TaxID=453783 RepID=UPI003CF11BBB